MYYALKYIVKGTKPKKGSVFTRYWQFRHPCGFESPHFEWRTTVEASSQREKLRAWLYSQRNYVCPCRKKVWDYIPTPLDRKRYRANRNRLWWKLRNQAYVKRRLYYKEKRNEILDLLRDIRERPEIKEEPLSCVIDFKIWMYSDNRKYATSERQR